MTPFVSARKKLQAGGVVSSEHQNRGGFRALAVLIKLRRLVMSFMRIHPKLGGLTRGKKYQGALPPMCTGMLCVSRGKLTKRNERKFM